MKKHTFALTLLVAASLAWAEPSLPCANPMSVELAACTRPASEGLAAINIGGRWAFVGLDGRVRIAAQFDDVGRFAEGKAPARKGDRWGYIDQQGSWVIEPRFQYAKEFSENRAFARDEHGLWSLIGPAGQSVAPLPPGAVPLDEKPWQSGLMLRGRAVVELPRDQLLVTPQGVVPIPPGVEVTSFPLDGLIVAEQMHAEGRKFGYLDMQGRWAIEPTFDVAWAFMSGYAAVRQNGQWSLINLRGETVRRLTADEVEHGGDHWLLYTDGETITVNADGTRLERADRSDAEPLLPSLSDDLREHYLVRELSRTDAALPLALLIPKDGVDRPPGLVDARGNVHFGGDWLAFPHDAELITELPIAVETLGGIGAVDGEGRWVVQPVLDELSPFHGGKAPMKLGVNHGVAFADGRLSLPPPGTRWLDVLKDGLIGFRTASAVGVVRAESGEVLWSTEEDIHFVAPNAQTYSVDVDGKLGVKNAQGKWLLEPECDRVEHLDGDIWTCRQRRPDDQVDIVMVDGQGKRTPILAAEKLSRTIRSTWLLYAEERSGVLFPGHAPVWIDEVLWRPSDDTDEMVTDFDEAVLVNRRLNRYAVLDAQGLTLSIHHGKYVVRTSAWPEHLMFQQESGVSVVAGDAVAQWSGYVTDARRSTGIVTVTADDEAHRASLRTGDGTVHSEFDGMWRFASPRWLVNRDRSDHQRERARLRSVATGVERELPYAYARDAGAGFIAVRDDDGRWGWIDERLKPVVSPRYVDVGTFSQEVVWAQGSASLELLDAQGKRLGRLNYECDQPQWVPATGKKAAGC